MRHSLPLLAALLASTAANATPTISAPLSDHAVVQRGQPVVLRGTAAPGEVLTVTLGDASASVAADSAGKWQAQLPAPPAGGPYRAVAKGADGSEAMVSDILSGDVWLCSGQSNMEFQVAGAQGGWGAIQGSADPELRLITVPQRIALDAGGFPDQVPAWQAAAPDSVRDFSAACYFMVRELRRTQKVPIGAIDASWGGTQIRPWIPADDARALPGGAESADLLALYRSDPSKAVAQVGARWGEWWRGKTGDKPGEEPWNDPDRRAWAEVPAIEPWEHWGKADTKDLNGMVWFRRTVTLDKAQAKQGATLNLGVLDDMDTVWVNGVAVGSSFGWSNDRHYPVPASVLKKGANEIIVTVTDTYGEGGFHGPAEKVSLTLAGGETIALGTGWRYSVQVPDPGGPPRTPWESHAGLATIYNGMVAPLGPLRLKGVAWYQGESDSGIPGYDKRMAALMAGWRRQFGDSALPFLIVSIANWNTPAPHPMESGAAQVRDEQRKAAEADAHAAVVTTIDIGDRLDLHPGDKAEVGLRLARAASVLAYGAAIPPSGPLVVDAKRDGGDVVVRFKGVTGALHAWSAPGPISFELCDASACRFANASVADADTVRIIGDGKPVTRIRYGWAEAPIVNLYDEAPLPAAPFEVAVE